MSNRSYFRYYDLNRRIKCENIDILFPSWGKEETLAIFSPHDDDAILGAGYAMLASLSANAEVYVFIFCDGCGGYSLPKQKDSIVRIREEESTKAYAQLGIDEDHIFRLGYHDYSVTPYLGWKLPSGVEGTLMDTLPRLREINATRLLIPNGYREHIDHTAVSQVGVYDGPQVGDPVLADLGEANPIKSYVEYAVWGDFSPWDSLMNARKTVLRGNRVIAAGDNIEEKIRNSIRQFKSQKDIIRDLIAYRDARRFQNNYIEIYLDLDPRPTLDYKPYKNYLKQIEE